ncbi:MAG TPA: hypothetical protein DE061_02720 [Clostridiales bacterium]|nr:hypothetical protein [Clostridiales bacterium]HCH92582.1 hypothetical protein [Clostridiales bacterium]
MKNKGFLAKIVALTLTVCTFFACVAFLVSCDKDEVKAKTVEDIFKSTKSNPEFSGVKREFTLDTGWSIYTTSTAKNTQAVNVNSDVGYIESLDAFVVSNGDVLSIVKCGDTKEYFDGGMKGMILPASLGISALRVKDGLIACKFNDYTAGVFDSDGRTVLSRTKINWSSNSGANIDSILKILDSGLIAVNSAYDRSGTSGYTSIYRPSVNNELSQCGTLVAKLENAKGTLTDVKGFDGKYVTITGNTAGDYIFAVPSNVSGEVGTTVATANGTVADNDKDDYYGEITYMGGGKFFIHQDWTVEKDEEYTYYDGFDYYVFSRRIYTPDNDNSSEYTKNSDKVFIYLENNYYDGDKAGIATSQYLKDGFTYASYGLTIRNKIGTYDQFILDENFNVVMSLTGNYGITIKDQKKEKVGYYDLIMQCVDGYYYNPVLPSEFNVYDKDGNRIGHNSRNDIQQQELSNGIFVVAVNDPDDTSSNPEKLYGAFNLRGEVVVPFKYLSLSAFRGSYTVGKAKNEDGVATWYIVGSDGNQITQMTDGSTPLAKDEIATDSNGNFIYKIGCYMYKVDSGEKDSKNNTIYKYGIKNFNPNVNKNVVMNATMSAGSVLYAPTSSPSNVFVFDKVTVGNNVSYTVYRLI